MAKKIVFCADGTWNNPYEDETAEHPADPTNVYKLFLCLAGSLSLDSLLNSDEQEGTHRQWPDLTYCEIHSWRRRFAQPAE